MHLAALLAMTGLAVSGTVAQETPANAPAAQAPENDAPAAGEAADAGAPAPDHPLRDKMHSDAGDLAEGRTTLTIRLNADGETVTYKGKRLTFEELEHALARDFLALDRTPEGELHTRVDIIADYERQQAQVTELMAICRDIGFRALAVESTSAPSELPGEEVAEEDGGTNLVNLAALVGVVLLLVMAVCLRGGGD